MVDERVPFPAKVVKEYWVTRYRVHSRTVPRYRDGRVFLVGDAAHVHSPAGAQGMNTGIQDAYNLAWKLALVERGLADESLVDSYQAERHPIGVQLLKTTDRLFSAFGGQNPLARLARGRVAPLLADRVLTRPWLRRRFIGLLAQLRLHYPDSPLNAEDGSGWRHAPAPGDRAREADVIIDGRAGRLYEVLRGTQHTVLLFTGLDDDARPAVELCRIAEQIEQMYPGTGEGARRHRRALRRSPCGTWRSDAVGTPSVWDRRGLRVRRPARQVHRLPRSPRRHRQTDGRFGPTTSGGGLCANAIIAEHLRPI